ncbi:uncharacterized MFS-type transporter C09D4.1-like [Anthonomus grandis grandis]|uniref:uncharacterized MFS-type transporter C09D4.1-like n=1 Tax=Anthonomus grandis grandis TaxID=2921223 RepID=UPI002165AA7B|nr:uncharacterized MFS-type transporter C09D4.1-like [Anthonomus grandis grandis]
MAKILVKLGARLKKVKMTADKSAISPMFEVDVVKAFKRRWYILAMYVYYATLSCFQWVEYSIITNIVMRYYNVSSKMVDWTGVMFMIVWPIFVFPSSFLIDKLGLRFAALTGCFLTAIGATVKVCLVRPDSFWVVMVGQAIVSVSQLFTLSLPPKLAVTWFKPNEISTVCSIGVFGMQLGSAMGFLIPPIIVEDDPNIVNVGIRLNYLCRGLSLLCIPACIAIVWYFPDMPAYPPSEAQAMERKSMKHVTWTTYMGSLKELFTNKGFLIHTLAYSISYGIFSAFGTLLNQFILSYFPGAAQDAGRMGLVMILVGMSGGVLAGYVLDKTRKYKETNFVIYIGTVVCLGGLLVSLQMKAKYVVYVTIGIFGFFLNAYIPAGIEFASELTYPANESTTTSLITAASQTLGVTFTLMLGEINTKWGTFWAIIIQISLLIAGCILTMFVPNNLRRQAAFNKALKFTEVPQHDPNDSETV